MKTAAPVSSLSMYHLCNNIIVVCMKEVFEIPEYKGMNDGEYENKK